MFFGGHKSAKILYIAIYSPIVTKVMTLEEKGACMRLTFAIRLLLAIDTGKQASQR